MFGVVEYALRNMLTHVGFKMPCLSTSTFVLPICICSDPRSSLLMIGWSVSHFINIHNAPLERGDVARNRHVAFALGLYHWNSLAHSSRLFEFLPEVANGKCGSFEGRWMPSPHNSSPWLPGLPRPCAREARAFLLSWNHDLTSLHTRRSQTPF